MNLGMRRKTTILAYLAAVATTLAPLPMQAAWQSVSSEPGKRVEIDRDSIASGENGEVKVRGRIVLDKSIVDPRTSSPFRVIEFSNRFDCKERTYATLKRAYYKENGELLRQEEVRLPDSMPVRSGTPDDRLFRDVCRPEGATSIRPQNAGKTIEKVNEAAAELRQFNQSMLEKELKKSRSRRTDNVDQGGSAHRLTSSKASKNEINAGSSTSWGYEGAVGPDRWSSLRPEFRLCASGRRQSPIDLQDGIAVDLEPIQFFYPPSPFKVIDAGRSLVVTSQGGGLTSLGKTYALKQISFHRPAEMTVAGRSFDMDVQLLHRAEDGQQAIVSILLVRGAENQVVQNILNNLPLERGGEVFPPSQMLEIDRLLPADRRYYAFMGSLTSPPCTEDVLWMVLKEPQGISAEQLDIFKRLYSPNARPTQPGFARIVKESR